MHDEPEAGVCKEIAHRAADHTHFTFSNIGKELIHISNAGFSVTAAGRGTSYAVFRDLDNTFLYGFEAIRVNMTQHFMHKLPEDAQTSNCFAVSDNFGYFYYSNGTSLSAWKPLSQEVIQTGIVLADGEVITYLGKNGTKTSQVLLIGSYHPGVKDSGVLRSYSIEPVSGALTWTGEEHSHLGKIVDVRRK